MITDLLLPLIAVGLAELGDKTQLSILVLSSKTTKHLHLFLGVTLAFLIVDGIAVLVGGFITTIISTNLLKAVSGSLFIFFGVLMVREAIRSKDGKMKRERSQYLNTPFLSGFLLVFLTEWGDKTQLAAAVFATRYNPILVFIGTMIALLLLSLLAIFLGRLIANKIDRTLMTKIAGIIFIIIGVSIFFL